MSNRNEVYEVLSVEREYQDKVWPKPAHSHELESYVLYMDNYLHKLKTVLTVTDQKDLKNQAEALNILRKVTALGVAAMEQHGALDRFKDAGPF